MSLLKYDYDRRNDPFSAFDTMFNRVFRDGWGWSVTTPEYDYRAADGFRMDLLADDNAYTVVAELPGLSKEDLDIQLHNAVVTISGERKQGEGENVRSVKFSRSITLGDDINTETVSARMENGLLIVTLPKSEASRPRAIAIS